MEQLANIAAYYLQQLREMRLEVCLIDDRRVAVSHNPVWYQELCRSYMSSRKRYPKLRTYIKRRATIRCLNRFIDGSVNLSTLYAQRILPFLENPIL